MAVEPEGTPCWADAMFTDVEGAKSFYGEVLGWTFGESSSEFSGPQQEFAALYGEMTFTDLRAPLFT